MAESYLQSFCDEEDEQKLKLQVPLGSAKRRKWVEAPSFVYSKLFDGFPITSFDHKMC